MRKCVYTLLVIISMLVIDSRIASGVPYAIAQQHTAEMLFVRAADIDLDNYTDIIFSTTNLVSGTSGGLWIAYGNAMGDLDAPARILVDRQTAITVDFVNRDSLPDIVAAGSIDGLLVHVLLNNGNRTFATSSFSNVSDVVPAVATGYFNNDPFLDIVVSGGTIYAGDGTGSFASQASLPYVIKAVDVADFNRDGHDDLVVNALGEARILLVDSLGTITLGGTLFTGNSTSAISTGNGVADFNRDGNVDFAVVTYLGGSPPVSSKLTLGFGNGMGGILASDTLTVVGYGLVPVIADVDRDNFLDVTTSVASTPDRLISWLGNGSTDFVDTSITTFAFDPGNILGIATIDLNRDGNPDFVTGSAFGSDGITLITSLLPPTPIISDEMVVTALTDTAAAGFDVRVVNPDNFEISQDSRTVAGSFYWRLDSDSNTTIDNRSVDYNLQLGEYCLQFIAGDGGPSGSLTATIGINGSQQYRLFQEYSGISRSSFAPGDTITFCYAVESTSSIAPVNGLRTQSQQPAFQWKGVFDSVGVTKYHFQLDETHDLSTTKRFEDSSMTVRQYLAPSSLGNDSVFYWRVRAQSGSIWSEWSRAFAAYIGPGCCVGIRGNANNVGAITVADLTYLVSYLFSGGATPPCTNEANVNGAGGVTVADLTYLVNFLFNGGQQPPACP